MECNFFINDGKSKIKVINISGKYFKILMISFGCSKFEEDWDNWFLLIIGNLEEKYGVSSILFSFYLEGWIKLRVCGNMLRIILRKWLE